QDDDEFGLIVAVVTVEQAQVFVQRASQPVQQQVQLILRQVGEAAGVQGERQNGQIRAFAFAALDFLVQVLAQVFAVGRQRQAVRAAQGFELALLDLPQVNERQSQRQAQQEGEEDLDLGGPVIELDEAEHHQNGIGGGQGRGNPHPVDQE